MATKASTRLTLFLAVVAVLMAAVAGTAQTKPSAKASKTPQSIHALTLQNLQAAYNGETNAHAKYLAFAQKADEEGYHGAGSLFRAAARAEQIHLTNHAAVIREMGAEPQAEIKTPVVKSTLLNLQSSANRGEAYERDTMYPRFIKLARLEGNSSAVRTFEYARAAEAEHFKLFAAAARNLESMKDATTYYVCTVCGYTTHDPQVRCPSCRMAEEKYEKVS